MKKLLFILLLVLALPAYATNLDITPSNWGDVTFYKDYSDEKLNANWSAGSPTATFSASRDNTHPATYFDADGIMQKTETSDVGRFNRGYWNDSGWHAFSQAGLIIESASTNYLTDSMFGRAIGADDWGSSWGTITDTATDLINISGAKERNVAYTFDGTEGNSTFALKQNTANDSFDASGGNIDVTVSFWAKGDISGITTGVGITLFIKVEGRNNAEAWKESIMDITLNHASVSNLHATEWRRFIYSGTVEHTDTRKIQLRFIGLQSSHKPTSGENFDLTITGVQIEKSNFAMSFIPTATASLTRNAETLKYKTAGNRTAAMESFVAKLAPGFDNDVTTDVNFIVDTDTKQRYVYFSSGANDVLVEANHNDSPTCKINNLINTAWTANTEMTLGNTIQHSSPYIAGYWGGVADGTNETSDDFTNPAWGTYFWVGSNRSGAKQFNGTIFSIAFFSDVLDADDMLMLHNNL